MRKSGSLEVVSTNSIFSGYLVLHFKSKTEGLSYFFLYLLLSTGASGRLGNPWESYSGLSGIPRCSKRENTAAKLGSISISGYVFCSSLTLSGDGLLLALSIC